MDYQEPSAHKQGRMSTYRVFVVGLVVVLGVIGLSIIEITIGHFTLGYRHDEPVNALARSRDECVVCHLSASAGIVEQYGRSSMAAAEVTCRNCHEVPSDYPGASLHMDEFYILSEPTPGICRNCHEEEVAQFYESRHSAPAYAAIEGTDSFTPAQMEIYNAIPGSSVHGNIARRFMLALQGPELTRFSCLSCHAIGKPQPDGSIGECQQCHLRHEFSLEQSRKPETCNHCHIGPTHPMWEIYIESPHGIAAMTTADQMHWEAEAGTLTVNDFPAPNCAICHMSGFGATTTTHNVGSRLTWFLTEPISELRPNWEPARIRMTNVCNQCHNETFVGEFFTNADAATEVVNDLVMQSQATMDQLREKNLLTPELFDEQIEYEFFELWHHWGRSAKLGIWMQGPGYVEWHGAYEMIHSATKVEAFADDLLNEAGLTTGTEGE